MSLRGNIDEFTVEAVLRLLESAASTGVLHVECADRRATVWLRKGSCLWAETELPRAGLEPAEALTDAVFELSQLRSGVFRFSGCAPDALKPPTTAPRKLRDLLREVGERASEWTRALSELPSLDHVVELAPLDAEGDLVIRPEQWRLLAKINGGVSVRHLLSSGDGLWRSGTVLASLLGAGLVRASERGAEPHAPSPPPPSELVDEITALGSEEEPDIDEPDIVVVTADAHEAGPDEPEDEDVRRMAGTWLRDLSEAQEGEEAQPRSRFLRLLSGER